MIVLKTCTMCDRSLTRDNFGPDKRRPDHLRSRCFDCRREEGRMRYARHRDVIRARAKQQYAREHEAARARARSDYHRNRLKFALAAKAYSKTPAGRRAQKTTYRRQRAKNPDAFRARVAVARALASGKLKRKPCSRCGVEPAQAHHHRGYDRAHALDVIWLYKPCHIIEHGHRPLLTAMGDNHGTY